MHHKVVLIADTRNDLGDVSRILSDRVGTLGFRCNNVERVDNRVIYCLILFIAAEAVDDLAAVLRVGCLGNIHERIVECRDQHICISLLSIDVLAALLSDIREIEIHLKAGDLLVVLDCPLNSDRLARSCLIHVVACDIVSDLGVFALRRDEVVDDRISRNSFLTLGCSGGVFLRCIADNDVDAVHHKVVLIADTRDDLANVS